LHLDNFACFHNDLKETLSDFKPNSERKDKENNGRMTDMCNLMSTYKRAYIVLSKFANENVAFNYFNLKLKKNSVAFSPQANYTDRATAACRQS
jgi:hypothetical protein